MSEHGALGAAGGAGCVDEASKVIAAQLDGPVVGVHPGGKRGERAFATPIKIDDGVDLVAVGDRPRLLLPRGIADDHPRLGIGNEIFGFGENGAGYIRLSYAASEAELSEALDRMRNFLG